MKTDWIYCRLVDRGQFILPKHHWLGDVELNSDPEDDPACAAALATSMQAFAVSSEAQEGWQRLIRARLVLLDDSLEGASADGAVHLRETVRLFNAYVTFVARIDETSAGYLYDLRARRVHPLLPPIPVRTPGGISAMIDERAHHPQHVLNLLLAASAYGELGKAFRRAAHWLELAEDAEDASERLLLNWMAAECLAKLGENDMVASRLLAASGLPSKSLASKLAPSDAAAIASLPNARSTTKQLRSALDRIREARNTIVHSGYRNVDLVALLTNEQQLVAHRMLPIMTKCLCNMALMAMNFNMSTLQELWSSYPAHIPNGPVRQAEWFLDRVADVSAKSANVRPGTSLAR